MKPAHEPISYTQYGPGAQQQMLHGDVIVETPVSLTVNGEVWLTFMCTPVDLEAMAVGFLFNEGIIKGIAEVASVRVCAHQDNVDVWLTHNAEKPDKWRRTSGCTGGVTAVDASQDISPVHNGGLITTSQVGSLIDQLFAAQILYRSSGGVHTSALSDGHKLLVVTEDIGRHNTLDKIAGRILLDRLAIERKIILSTGRISSEMLQKSARMQAAIVISRTSPSSLSIQLAEAFGITLIGYARRNRFNIYTHAHRIMSVSNVATPPHILSKKKPSS